MSRPVFVVCGPRSGSTFVVALLGGHGRIQMTNEAAWVTYLRKTFLLASTPSSQQIEDGEGFATPGILPEKYTEAIARSHLSVMRLFVTRFYRRAGSPIDGDDCAFYGDKVMSVNDLRFAAEWFDEAVFVHLVRDPRDVIASTFAFSQKHKMLWDSATFDTRVSHMAEFLGKTGDILRDRRSLLLRYEDLLEDPERRVAELFAFLELDVDGGVREFLDGESQRLFANHGTSASPTASIGRWRRDLSAEQQTQATAGLAAELARYGYESA